MIDYGRVSRIIDFCLSRLTTQSVIDAKAEAIKECMKPWFQVYEERNLSDPECHYESILHKYAWPLYSASLDRVASEHEDLVRSTPAIFLGELHFVEQQYPPYTLATDVVYCLGNNTTMWMTREGMFFGVKLEGDYMNVYQAKGIEIL